MDGWVDTWMDGYISRCMGAGQVNSREDGGTNG